MSQPMDSGRDVSPARSDTTSGLTKLSSIETVDNSENASVFKAPRTATQQAVITPNIRPKRAYTSSGVLPEYWFACNF
jgi:hypothetical protein